MRQSKRTRPPTQAAASAPNERIARARRRSSHITKPVRPSDHASQRQARPLRFFFSSLQPIMRSAAQSRQMRSAVRSTVGEWSGSRRPMSYRSYPGCDKSGSYVEKRIHEVTNRLIYCRFERIHSRNLNEDYRYTECNPIGSDSYHRSCRRRSTK